MLFPPSQFMRVSHIFSFSNKHPSNVLGRCNVDHSRSSALVGTPIQELFGHHTALTSTPPRTFASKTSTPTPWCGDGLTESETAALVLALRAGTVVLHAHDSFYRSQAHESDRKLTSARDADFSAPT